jgi:hypothetical protein
MPGPCAFASCLALLAGCQPSPDGERAIATASAAASRCIVGTTDVSCSHEALLLDGRAVPFATPLGNAPAGGWPLALIFQGTGFGPATMWHWTILDPVGDILGGRNQVLLVKSLLDSGFAVITPSADLDAFVWDTNIPPFDIAWTGSPDDRFLRDLFAAIDGGAFGTLSSTRWYATGVSSGGYMTSRMAVSYAGRFRALAIESASYATCSGPLCLIPALPANHPPTLFLHGALDVIVPVVTALAYEARLRAMHVPTNIVIDPLFGHGWIPAAPAEVAAWFQAHP